ncbi:ATP-binding protein [Hyalangium sp.]|uniref:ATP-binding protein n=1 Tax=Hyalangium sp. TaxID=2028555 RepID=UPI002D2467D1|nr:ATP-binding protein [Hyalangium sp.]HYI03153.1 ATP-binding protein [Hyalangium sp.]
MDEQTPGLEVHERATVAEVVTAVLRHDLRNRFSSIRNASYYLMRQVQKTELWKADPRMETFFQLIDRELVSAEELLSASGLRVPQEDSGRLRLCDVAERALAHSRVPVSVRVERTWQERALVQADAERLTLLIRCLIENAVEAMPGGGILGVHTLRGEEERVILEVTDTGPGIPQELRARVFEPFMTTKPGHAGLGLCIVQRLALRSRAWVELKAGEPVGTQVRVSFPIVEEAGASGGA